jgi:hypothetical protein
MTAVPLVSVLHFAIPLDFYFWKGSGRRLMDPCLGKTSITGETHG